MTGARTSFSSPRRAGTVCAVPPGARDEVDREFLAPLGDELAREFIRALQILARED